MNLDIKLQFFQSAATVLPSIFVAFALTSHLLDPSARQGQPIRFFFLSGRSGIITLSLMTTGFVAAEVLTLIILATDSPTFPVFVIVISYVFVFAWFVGLKAMDPMFQDAVATAVRNAPTDEAKAKVVSRYQVFGNVIIVGSLVFIVGLAVIFFALRA